MYIIQETWRPQPLINCYHFLPARPTSFRRTKNPIKYNKYIYCSFHEFEDGNEIRVLPAPVQCFIIEKEDVFLLRLESIELSLSKMSIKLDIKCQTLSSRSICVLFL